MLDEIKAYDEPDEKERARWIGIYIGVLAVLLAVCTMLGGNSTKDAMRANIDLSDTYNFYQAKNSRQMMLRLHAEALEFQLTAMPGMAADLKQALESKVKEHRAWADRYESDPKTQEGKKELLAKAKTLEDERNLALRKDPYFDLAQALIQIAIVLASVSLLTQGRFMLLLSGAVGIAGTLMLINGHLMLFPILGAS